MKIYFKFKAKQKFSTYDNLVNFNKNDIIFISLLSGVLCLYDKEPYYTDITYGDYNYKVLK